MHPAGCTKKAQSRGKCKTHGGGRRCEREGCDKSAQVSTNVPAVAARLVLEAFAAWVSPSSRGLCGVATLGCFTRDPRFGKNRPLESRAKALVAAGGCRCVCRWAARLTACVMRGGGAVGDAPLQGARRRQALPDAGLPQVRGGQHAALHRARRRQALPGPRLHQVGAGQHQHVQGAWRRQALRARRVQPAGAWARGRAVAVRDTRRRAALQGERARWVTLRASLGDAESSLGDAESSLGDAESFPG
jgi:hypothetical protein